ncbi:29505_t:CDS:2 [Racocetra persica]|uniref:29505_t:CDS:1 n=1 Tax=Racocetra persica TaxID=160502 RepID=A0ACA9KBV9_9GLOM|nr:29505_t:CDS:2 [Racocetra persica]
MLLKVYFIALLLISTSYLTIAAPISELKEKHHVNREYELN